MTTRCKLLNRKCSEANPEKILKKDFNLTKPTPPYIEITNKEHADTFSFFLGTLSLSLVTLSLSLVTFSPSLGIFSLSLARIFLSDRRCVVLDKSKGTGKSAALGYNSLIRSPEEKTHLLPCVLAWGLKHESRGVALNVE